MSQIAGGREPLPESTYHPAGKRRRTSDRDLLAKNRSNCEFETIPASRHSQPGMGCNPRRQYRVGSQSAHDGLPICVEIKHGADALNDKEQRAGIAKLNPQGEGDVPLVK